MPLSRHCWVNKIHISMKNFTKMFVLSLCLVFFAVTMFSQLAVADSFGNPGGDSFGNPPAGSFSLKNPLSDKFNSVGGLVSGFIEIFSYVAIIFAVLALVWVGFQFVLARGNPAKLTELKKWLLGIVIGVAIVIGARVIITIVINTLKATGTVDERVIQSANKGLNNQ